MRRERVRVLAAALVFLAPAALMAATKAPVVWSVKQSPAKAVKRSAKFSVTVAGQIDPGWHLYAMEEPQGGPVATVVALAEGDPADLIRVEEGKPKMLPDPVFGKPTGFFEGSAAFTLRLTLDKNANPGAQILHVLIKYQSCNDRLCLPPRTDTVIVPVTVE